MVSTIIYLEDMTYADDTIYFTTSKVARRLDIITGHSPFSSYSENSPSDKSMSLNLVPAIYTNKNSTQARSTERET